MKSGIQHGSKICDLDIRDAFFDEIYELASKDSQVMFLTADMGAFSLNKFKKYLSQQYINVGVAEQSLISIAAGLALDGKKVFVYAIAPFVTERCYEQIRIDICSMHLPVVVIGVGVGIAYSSDGPTHHAIRDISIMRALPEMTIFNPSESAIAAAIAHIAYKSKDPVYVRIDKGKHPSLYDVNQKFINGISLLKKGSDLIIVTTGVMVHHAMDMAEELRRHSIDAGVIDLYRIKPLNEELMLRLIGRTKRLVTLEEHSVVGGIGSIISEMLIDNELFIPLKRIGIIEKFINGYGDRNWMLTQYDLNTEGVVDTIVKWLDSAS